jgi:hypothetical protein
VDELKPGTIAPLWNGKWAVRFGGNRWEVTSVDAGLQLLKDGTLASAVVEYNKSGKAVTTHRLRDPAPVGMGRPVPPPGVDHALIEPFVPRRVQSDYRQANRIAEVISHHVWPILAALFGPTFVASVVTPEIAAADSFPALFAATLSWSLGVGLCTVLLLSGGLKRVHPYALWVLVGAIFASSSATAASLAVGQLDDPGVCYPACNWRTAPLEYAGEAVATFKPAGFALGTAAGLAAGAWAWSLIRRQL